MKKYSVSLYFHTMMTVEVEAENEKAAIRKAYAESDDPKYNEAILRNLQEDDDPSVTEL